MEMLAALAMAAGDILGLEINYFIFEDETSNIGSRRRHD